MMSWLDASSAWIWSSIRTPETPHMTCHQMTKQSGPDGWIQTSVDESSSWRQSSGSMLDQDQAGGWTEPGWPRLDASR